MTTTDEEPTPATSAPDEATNELASSSESAPDESPDELATSSNTETPTASRPARWLRSRRRRGLRVAIRFRRRLRRGMTAPRIGRASAALSAMLAALLASGGWYVTVGPPVENQAAELVSGYLEALLDGDTEAALEIAGVSKPPAHDEFLTAEALSANWRIDSVTPALDADVADDNGAGVRVRISDEAGRTTHGEFFVEESRSDGLRIANPFVYVRSEATDAPSYLDLNGTVAAVASAKDEVAALPVFPGSYELYSKHKSLFTVDPARALLLPTGSATSEDEAPQGLVFDVSVTGKGQRSVQKTLTALVDECADSSDLAPSDCPFSAEDDLYQSTVTTDEQYFADVEDISWEVTEHPKVTMRGRDGGFGLTLRNDTAIRLTGTGVPVFGDDDEKAVEFTVDCPYNIDGIIVSPTASGSFTLSMPDSAVHRECELR